MKKKHWFIVSLIVILLDQATKYWVGQYLMPYTPVPVIPMFNITLAYNTGAAFSFLSGAGVWHRILFAGFSLVMSILLAILLWRTNQEEKLQAAGLSLILGGAVGNLIDRAFFGYVVDFIDLYYKNYHFATFNVADSAICIGAVFFAWDLLFSKKQP
jgi:signal peptidase II